MNSFSSTPSPICLPAYALCTTFLEYVGRSKSGRTGARRTAGELGVHFVMDGTAGAWGAAHVGIIVRFCLGKWGGKRALVKIPVMKGNPTAVRVSPALCSSTDSFPICTLQCLLTVLLAQAGGYSSHSAWIKVHTELYWTANNYIWKKQPTRHFFHTYD